MTVWKSAASVGGEAQAHTSHTMGPWVALLGDGLAATASPVALGLV